MKKLLLVFFLGISFAAFSQDVKYGVRGGYTISNLDFKDVPFMENKHRNSFYVGFFSDIAFTNTFSLVPELQFSAEGAKAEVLHLDYIQMPIFLKFKVTDKLRLGVAPQVGLKTHKEDDMMRNFAYSGVVGLECKLSYTLFLDVRYTYGFTNIFDDVYTAEAKNTNFQIGIGYQF